MISPHQALLELARRQIAKQEQSSKSYCPHEPTSKQRAFVEYDGLEALYGGAAGGGKSDALLMSALRYVHVPGYAALILRRTFPDLTLKGAIMDRSHDWLRESDAVWDAANKRWRFPSGATLTFGYLENPGDEMRYKSAEFQSIGFDELTQFQRPQYTYLFSRLRKAGVDVPLRMRAATNPGDVGHAWVRERWAIPEDVDMEKVHDGPDGRVFFPAKLDDNQHIDIESYERSLAQLEFTEREHLRRGSWRQDASGLVYAFDEFRDCADTLPQLPEGMSWSNVLGIDYGNVNATALVVLRYCLDLSDVVYVAESQKWAGLIPSEAADIVGKWSERYGGFVAMVGDTGGLGKGYVEEARQRFALPIEPAEKQNKYGYVKLINGAYQSNRLKIVRAGNPELIKELKEHPWKSGKQYLEEQPGSPNHACDAHLYGWRAAVAWAHRAKGAPGPKPGTTAYYEAEAQRAREQAELDAQRDPFNTDDPWARE